MAKNLVIVESPAKAKTIESYLGENFKVASSYGHVRDLPKEDSAVDVNNDFEPTYEIPEDKKKVIEELKKLTRDSELVYLASDDDREGEAISWHLKEVLDLNDSKTRRIVFREITKNAIMNALESPRGIDKDLVNAQQARRVLDRLVGFELSPILWRKIKTGLSAGRVQSVAVRLVVEREREIEKFEPKSSFKVTALFDLGDGNELTAELPEKFRSEDEAKEFLENCKFSEFAIKDLQKKPSKKSPAPPFTTSTLQQEASRKLGFSVSQTMTIAQKLYENGKISYMRTDSVNLSKDAVNNALKEIKNSFGEKYVQHRNYKTKTTGAQEAHEAIRPTNFSDQKVTDNYNDQRLYELIWKRAIASQMADAQIEKTTATIGISNQPQTLTATGEIVTFDGFLKVYIESKDEEEAEGPSTTGMLPPLAVGQVLNLDHMQAKQIFTRSPARFTEASLVKKLEEMGIGRPSTYAPTISTIQKRDYVIKESRSGTERNYKVIKLQDQEINSQTKAEITGTEKNKLFPTNMAMVVNDFLVEYFPDVTNYSFTAKVEKEFDDIARGKRVWNEMISDFYKDFHSKVENTKDLKRQSLSKIRELGEDPESGKKIFARMAKYGPVVQKGEGEEAEYASLRKGQFLDSINLEQALELFKLPREIGVYEGENVVANIGKYGPYLRHKDKFHSLGKEEDPFTIDLNTAIEIIEEKRKTEAQKYIKTFEENPDVLVLRGRYGPYIKVGKKNVRIPKDKKPEELTLEECLELAEKAPEKKRGRRRKRK